MNPFTESTVARPLAKHHPDRCWSRPALDVCACLPVQEPVSSGEVAQATKAGAARRAGTGRRRSSRLALALGFCLSFSTVTGILSKPMLLTGGVAIATLMVPGQASAVDLNSASALELQSLNGIGPKTAAMIIEERTRGGKFSSLSDLSDRVKGIGPKKAASLQAAGLKVAGAQTADTKSKPPQTRKKGK